MAPRSASARIAILVACAMCCGAARSDAPRTRSDIKGFSLVSLAVLPRSPEDGRPDAYCEGYRARKLTAVGRSVAKAGWIVTSEAALGGYRVVTFASGFAPGTSALCYARDANIGIFRGEKLIALAYATGSERKSLGVVEPLEGGGLLIWTDPPGFPVGELHEANNWIRLTAIAPERTFCRRRAVVPNVYGEPIEAARIALMRYGWRPQRTEDPVEAGTVTELTERGVVEAESCSGTGVGYCEFNYRGPAGMLKVTTAGEYNRVVHYGVACAQDDVPSAG